MYVKGKVIQVLKTESGKSNTGKSWCTQRIVIKTFGDYPKRVCFEIFGEERIYAFAVQLHEVLKVHFELDSREFKGRWYTSARAWRVERDGEDESDYDKHSYSKSDSTSEHEKKEQESQPSTDDLPF